MSECNCAMCRAQAGRQAEWDRSWAEAAVKAQGWDYDPQSPEDRKAERVRKIEGWRTTDPRPAPPPALGPAFTPKSPVDMYLGDKRVFETGAMRDTVEGKLDFEGCLSPTVLERYAQYLLDHSVMPDGSRRSADNWQKGMPMGEYVKSAWRHFHCWWKWWRSVQIADKLIEEAACGILFNVMGWLHEHLKAKADREAGQAVVLGEGKASTN